MATYLSSRISHFPLLWRVVRTKCQLCDRKTQICCSVKKSWSNRVKLWPVWQLLICIKLWLRGLTGLWQNNLETFFCRIKRYNLYNMNCLLLITYYTSSLFQYYHIIQWKCWKYCLIIVHIFMDSFKFSLQILSYKCVLFTKLEF